jgi:uncharacterized protein (DUF885 family)
MFAAFAINVIWFKPISSRIFYERVFLEYGLSSPQLLSTLRLLESFGIRGHNAKLDDYSANAAEQQYAKIKADLATLRRYDRAGMNDKEQLNYDMLEWYLAHQAEGERWRYHQYPVNQLFGIQSELTKFMVSVHQINDVTDAEHYIARLAEFRRVLAEVTADLQLRQQHGVMPPRFVLDKVLSQVEAFTTGESEQQLLYRHFQEKLSNLTALQPEQKAELLAKAQQAITNSVIPGYQKLATFLQQQQQIATTDDGVWKLPNGNEYYAYLLKEHTTTNLTPEQILLSARGIELNKDFIASGYSSSWLKNNPEVVKRYSGKRRGDSYDKDAFWNLKISYSQILKLRR